MQPQDAVHKLKETRGSHFFSTTLQLREENTAEGNKIIPVLKGLSNGILGNIG